MRLPSKLVPTALAAALLLSAAITSASARRLEVSSQLFRATWFQLEVVESSGFFIANCPITLEGSFHSRTIPKVQRLLIGAITRVTIKTESCLGNPRIRSRSSSLPWHLTYESFTGTLPAITSVQLLISRFLFEFFDTSATCTYGRSTDNMTFEAVVSAGAITVLRPVAGRAIASLLEGNSFCAPTVSLREEGTVTVLNSTTRVTIRLI
jgi:hypothetical protein